MSGIISNAYKPQIGPSDMLKPNKCRKIKKTTTSDDRWNTFVPKKTAKRLKEEPKNEP
jgi:hypothetical protein